MINKFLLLLALISFCLCQIDPSKSYAVGTGTYEATAGNYVFFQIIAKDSSGNNVTNCDPFFELDWNVTLVSQDNVVIGGDVVTCNAPIYTGRYSLTKTGKYSLYISYSNTQIMGSPYQVNCVAGAIYPPACTSEGVHGVVVGTYDVFNVTTYDQNGNRNYSCQPASSWSVTVNSNPKSYGNLISCNQGFYIWEYTTTQAGHFDLQVLYTPQNSPIKGSPFAIVMLPGNVSAQYTFATGSGTNKAVAGQISHFQIDLKDQYNNDITECTVPSSYFESNLVRVIDGYTVSVNISSCVDGVFDCYYMTTKSNNYNLNIKYLNTPISGSPYLVDCDPAGIDGYKTIVSGSGITSGIAGKTSPIIITPFDKYDNPLDYCDSDEYQNWIIVLQNPNGQNISGSIGSCSNGIYQGSYIGYKAGTDNLYVSYKNEQAIGSPFHPQINASSISAPNCEGTGDGFFNASAGVLAQFQIETFDQYDNKIDVCVDASDFSKWFLQIQLDQNTFGNISLTGCSNGNYFVQYLVKQAGSWTLTVQWVGNNIATSPKVINVFSGPPVADNCFASGQKTTGSVAVPNTFILRCQDQYNNPVFVCYPLSNWAVTTIPSVNQASVTSCNRGTYQSSWIGYVAQSYNVEVRYNQQRINNVPFTTVLSAGSFNASTSIAQGPGVQLNGVQALIQTNFNIVSKDSYGNDVTTCESFSDWNINITGPANVTGLRITGCNNGIYSVVYTASKIGSYYVKISYNNTEISGSPYQVIVSAGVIDYKFCFASGLGLTNGSAGQVTVFNIQAVDGAGNNITICNLPLSNWIIDLSGPSSVKGSVVSCNSGVYVANYVANILGQYSMDVSYINKNDQIFGSPFFPFIVAGPPQPGNCVASGSGLVSSVAGDIANFTSYCKDQFENRVYVCYSSSMFQIDLTGASKLSGSVVSCNEGVYVMNYNATVSGTYNMSVLFSNVPIIGSPFTPVIIAGDLSPSTVYANGQGVQKFGVKDGVTAPIYVYAVDRFRNPITKCDQYPYSNWNITIIGDSITATIWQCNMGVYYSNYTAFKVETIYVQIFSYGVQIFGSPYEVQISYGNFDPGKSIAFGLGLTNGIAGISSVFYIQTRDQFSNNITDCLFPYDDWTIYLFNPSNSFLGLSNGCSNGIYSALYITDISGVYLMDVLYKNSTAVQNNPFSPNVVPNVVSNNSIVYGWNSTGQAGFDNFFFIQAIDRYGNNISECLTTQPYTITINGPSNTNETYVDCNSGVYRYKWVSTDLGLYSINAKLGESSIIGSPFFVQILPGPFNPSQTYAFGPGVVGVVAGVETFFQIISFDSFGNRVETCFPTSDWNITIKAQENIVATINSCRAGIYNLTYTAFVSENIIINIEFNNTFIKNSPYVVPVVAGPIVPNKCEAQGTGLQGSVAGEQSTFNILCYDSYDNLVLVCIQNLNEFSIEFKPIVPSGYVSSCLNGTYIANYVINITGNYKMFVDLNSTSIKNSPFDIVISEGSISPQYSYAVGSGVSNTSGINVLDRALVNIMAFNQYGVQFTSCPENPSQVFQVTINPQVDYVFVNCENGVFYSYYTTKVSGNYQVTINYNNSKIMGSPYYSYIKWGPIYPPNTRFSGLNNSIIYQGKFDFVGYDVYDNLVNEFSPGFGFVVQPVCSNTTSFLKYTGNGGYEATYSVPSAGIYCFDVYYDNDTLLNNDLKNGHSYDWDFYVHAQTGSNCPNCQNGICLNGICNCATNWQGKNCDQKVKRGIAVWVFVLVLILLLILFFFVGLFIGWVVWRRNQNYQKLD